VAGPAPPTFKSFRTRVPSQFHNRFFPTAKYRSDPTDFRAAAKRQAVVQVKIYVSIPMELIVTKEAF
jgi:hypothetical protein